MLTRVELREEMDEVPHLLLLGARGPLGVVGRHGVQEGPGAAAQLLAVQGAVGGRLLLLHRGHGARRCLLLLLAEPALEIRTGPARLLGLLLRSGAGSPRRNGERESERAAFGARERRSAAAGAALTGRPDIF